MSNNQDFDFIVVGAGVVGPAIATGLAKNGWSVLVLERDLSKPDRIVGELLQPGGVESLKKLGLESALDEADGVAMYGYEIIFNNKKVEIPYPPKKDDPKAKYTGRGFHHGNFIMGLRRCARETPGVTMIEGTVNELVTNPHTQRVLGVKATLKEYGLERHFFASCTIVCDGISSKFRKSYTPKVPTIKSYFAGLLLKNPVLPAPNHGHVIIGKNHQPILIYEVEKGEARILCDIPSPLPSAANGDLKKHLEVKVMPYLPESVRPSFEEALANQRIRTMPSQYLTASVNKVPGVIMIGDAMNMRHPLTGGGMTVALSDAVLLTDILKKDAIPDLMDTVRMDDAMKSFFWRRKNVGSVINVLSVALHSLFAADDENLEILQLGCFRYFERGGTCVSEPVSMLGGLLPEPFTLFYHFFSVALFGIYCNFADKGFAQFGKAFVQMFTVLWTACVVFLPYLWDELVWY